ncbi:MAG: protease complex subunit PrcB family protein [Aridibacter sp.]
MKHITVLIITLFLAMQNNCNAQNDGNKVSRKEIDKTKNTEVKNNTKVKQDKETKEKNNLKVLTDGSYSSVEDKFIFVARDKKSFETLSKLFDDFELKEKIDFEKNIVVAAFAGMLTTGGYSVEINETGGKISIKLNSPPKGGMVTQVLTQPFSVVLIPLNKDESLNLAVSDYWKDKSQNYSIKSGSIEYSGGIAGIHKQFEPEGTIQVYKLNKFVTLVLDLKGKGKESSRKLSEVISGELQDNSLTVENIHGGNLIEIPHPPVKFGADFSDNKISIKLVAEDKNSPVRDGFSGKGTLEAVKVN